MRNIAMLTMHSCPAGRPGARDVGGMNVYVTHVARELAKSGCRVDIYTRSDRAHGRHVANITPFVRVIHVDAGPGRRVQARPVGSRARVRRSR